ncbi:hypothetical protein ACWDFH_12480 [Streptomyces kronopolitis]
MDRDAAFATAVMLAVTNLAGLLSIALAAHRRAAIASHQDLVDD